MSPSMYLDRIAIGDREVAPRSATLRTPSGPGEARPETWSVTISCERLPDELCGGEAPFGFQGWAASGRRVYGSVRIQSRLDDAYGTKLTLVGVGPLRGWATSAWRDGVEGDHAGMRLAGGTYDR